MSLKATYMSLKMYCIYPDIQHLPLSVQFLKKYFLNVEIGRVSHFIFYFKISTVSGKVVLSKHRRDI